MYVCMYMQVKCTRSESTRVGDEEDGGDGGGGDGRDDGDDGGDDGGSDGTVVVHGPVRATGRLGMLLCLMLLYATLCYCYSITSHNIT